MAMAQAEDEDTLAEWVNGEVIMTRPASARHQDIVRCKWRSRSAWTSVADYLSRP